MIDSVLYICKILLKISPWFFSIFFLKLVALSFNSNSHQE